MQCRNALKRHVNPSAGALSHNTASLYQWITDDQLSEAFARFVKVSKSCRRFGSNVPGPLEARRRQSRRRMGFMTGDGYQGVGLTEFGALFGAGEQRSGIFKWEAPSRGKRQDERRSTINSFGGDVCIETIDGRRVRRPHSFIAEADSWAETSTSRETNALQGDSSEAQKNVLGGDAVSISRNAFGALLKQHEQKGQLSAKDIAPLLSFLESAEDEPQADNLLTLLQWLELRPIEASAFVAVRALVTSKHLLRTLSLPQFTVLVRPLVELSHKVIASPSKTDTLAVLADHIKHCHQAKLYPDQDIEALSHCLFSAITPPAPTLNTLDSTLEALSFLATKRDELSLRGHIVAQAIKNHLPHLPDKKKNIDSERYQIIVDALAGILNQSQEKGLAQAVMRLVLQDQSLLDEAHKLRRHRMVVFWLRCLHQSQRLSAKTPSDALVENWATYCHVGREYSPLDLAQHLHNLQPAELATALLAGWTGSWRLAPRLKVEQGEHLDHHEQPVQDGLAQALFHEFHNTQLSLLQNPLVTLLTEFRRQGRSTDRLLAHIVTIFTRGTHGGPRIYQLYHELRRTDVPIPLKQQASLINNLIRDNYTRRALYTFLESPKLPLSQVPGLASQLIATHNDPAWILLLIPDKVRIKQTGRFQQPLPQNVIDLVTEVAVEIAHAQHYTPKRAFDRVWRCYRFLSQFSVRIDKRISRAMVHSGIIRALQTRTLLPDVRLNYILNIVRWYEGDEVAEKLEERVRYERERLVLRGQLPSVFRPELGDLSQWSQRLLPRF